MKIIDFSGKNARCQILVIAQVQRSVAPDRSVDVLGHADQGLDVSFANCPEFLKLNIV